MLKSDVRIQCKICAVKVEGDMKDQCPSQPRSSQYSQTGLEGFCRQARGACFKILGSVGFIGCKGNSHP